MGLETAAIIGIAAAAASGTAAVYGATKSARAAEDAAGLQTSATNHAADLQAQANRDTLAFNKSAAENQYQNSEAARRGNYDLAANRSQYVGSIGDLVGLPPHPMPAYVPGVDPQFNAPPPATAPPGIGATMLNGVGAGVRNAASGLATAGQALGSGLQAFGRGLAHGAGSPQTPGSLGTAPTAPFKFNDPYTVQNMQTGATPPPGAIADPVMQALAQVYQRLGVMPTGAGSGPTDIAYYAQKVRETGGWTPDNANYWTNRIASDLKGAGPSPVGSVGSYLTTPSVYAPPLQTPALQMPGSVGSYL